MFFCFDRLIQEEVGFFFIMEEAEPLNSFRTEALGSAKSLVSFKERFLALRGSGHLPLEQMNRGSGRKELGGEGRLILSSREKKLGFFIFLN